MHGLVVVAVLAPTLLVTSQIADLALGAGGPGPVGGGGGGFNSQPGRLKWVPERVAFMKLEADAVPKQPEPVRPREEPIVPPPPPPPPEPAVTRADTAASAASRADSAGTDLVAGRGTGKDGTSGDGPGRGGGVGSGIGTGRGSAVGPGTGGGDDEVYAPSVLAIGILPIPVPPRVRPYRMAATFEVDTTGEARLIDFNPSRDAGYNRRIREMLLALRFRPAVTRDGRPVKARVVVRMEAL
ncbi:MAG: hypothetical protein HUU26_03250 [Gemmatimonadaceae bacterium]|nr:hypothetical protein [Gemmatimonadaceae bacterium]